MFGRFKEALFGHKDTRQVVAKNVFWLTISQVGTRLIRSLIIIYAARKLGAAGYGVFSYALGLAGFFTIFADIGVSSILTREASQKPERREHYFATAFWIKIILLFFAIALVLIAAPKFSRVAEATVLIPFVALITFFDGIRDFSVAFFRAQEKMEREAVVTILTNLAIAIFGFIVFQYSDTPRALIISYAGSTGVGAGIAFLFLRKEFAKVISHFDRAIIKPILVAAWPIALTSLFAAFVVNIDIIMLGWWRTTSEIGLYSAAQRVMQVFYSLPAILASATFPTLSRLIGEGAHEKIQRIMERIVTTSLLIAIPIATGGILLASPLMKLLYGESYHGAASSFQILMVSILFTFPGTIIVNFILAHDQQKKTAKYLIISSLVSVGLNALLIPRYGIEGASITLVVAQAGNNFLLWHLAKQLHNFFTLRNLRNALLATLGMTVGVIALEAAGVYFLITIALGAIMYGVLLWILKEPIIEEGLSTIRMQQLTEQG